MFGNSIGPEGLGLNQQYDGSKGGDNFGLKNNSFHFLIKTNLLQIEMQFIVCANINKGKII
jgi:hypothetical protein